MNLIEHVVDPSRLLLVWQAPDGVDRTRLVVGELLSRGGEVRFRYLPGTPDFKRAMALGFVCHPAFRKTNKEYAQGVADAFLRRVPPRKRGDFHKFLAQWRLLADRPLTDFALLAYSGARLPNDGFSLVWPLEEIEPPGEVLLEVAGFRYQRLKLDDLELGGAAEFVAEPENPRDSQAIRVEVRGMRIGYVNRLQCVSVHRWLANYRVEACVERINGTVERPVVYVFCRLLETSVPRLKPVGVDRRLAG